MSTEQAILTTADGTPLKISLQRAMRRSRLKALGLVAPLFVFILVSFLLPIGDMLLRGVENHIVAEELPRTIPLLSEWQPDSATIPSEAVFKALVLDFQQGAKNKTINRLGSRLNYEVAGISSLFRKTARKSRRLTSGPYQEAMIKIDKKWGSIETWKLLKTFSSRYTPGYYLAGADLKLNIDGEIQRQPEELRVYMKLFWRTLRLSAIITLLTLVLGYPIAYLMATLPTRTSNLLMIMVLLPFWTSLLVRTTAWIALLQQEGIINDFLVVIGLLNDDGRLPLIHNATGTIVAMTHILLPFMVLPLFSVMKTISPTYVRAAKSLGATPFQALIKVYMPNTIPGMGAGGILVFILAIGYYITPELVGGISGTFISNRIAYHISSSLNWGLAAALGAFLLLIVLALYTLYDKLVGIDNMKLG
ncbi:MAG: ABC transporter permease [Arenicellales bacterium]|jgi:putative spermidine/putrescine transport system permease protein|nr:ABC transporter permease [Arenicellales bacterium]MDP7155269.1 ABC transporter permease [Arenicellales bacterium]MDP7482135.1 ABC transporter permease [Arenicellales bacterium]MEE1539642.1 ABC transporter permease [Arenicellales bacterium]HJL65313.1 ABC transporter permease [Arenicellales bacterium]|tara:strand:+ start:2650 stop:3909 length:1260 start_codon:yes stop_codon:yes gene_type:complete